MSRYYRLLPWLVLALIVLGLGVARIMPEY